MKLNDIHYSIISDASFMKEDKRFKRSKVFTKEISDVYLFGKRPGKIKLMFEKIAFCKKI